MKNENTSSDWDGAIDSYINKKMFAHRVQNPEQIEVLRAKIREFPEDPQLWEQFALELSQQADVSKDDVINAYRQAEALYLDREDNINAAIVAKTIGSIPLD